MEEKIIQIRDIGDKEYDSNFKNHGIWLRKHVSA